MTEAEFNKQKSELMALIEKHSKDEFYSSEENQNYVLKLKIILDMYTYDNRLEKKGFLGHFAMDSGPIINDILGATLTKFDLNIT